MNTFENRLSIGDQGEKAVLMYLKLNYKNYEIYRQKDKDITWTPLKDKLYGDITIEGKNKTINVDVKVGKKNGTYFVSFASAVDFKGDGFVFIPYDMDIKRAFFVPTHSIKSYINEVMKSGNLVKGGSGDVGYYFTPSRMYRAQSFITYMKKI